MLVLSRYENERIIIGNDIVVMIVGVCPKTGKVKIGVDAPKGVRVDREEVRKAIERKSCKKERS
jgi:carbon storage regulator